MNCHGCKWLDEAKLQPNGSGYCCYVVKSKTQRTKVRYSYMERCELFSKGDFAARYGGNAKKEREQK